MLQDIRVPTCPPSHSSIQILSRVRIGRRWMIESENVQVKQVRKEKSFGQAITKENFKDFIPQASCRQEALKVYTEDLFAEENAEGCEAIYHNEKVKTGGRRSQLHSRGGDQQSATAHEQGGAKMRNANRSHGQGSASQISFSTSSLKFWRWHLRFSVVQ